MQWSLPQDTVKVPGQMSRPGLPQLLHRPMVALALTACKKHCNCQVLSCGVVNFGVDPAPRPCTALAAHPGLHV